MVKKYKLSKSIYIIRDNQMQFLIQKKTPIYLKTRSIKLLKNTIIDSHKITSV